jgi:phage/plasmid-like protein (TIGR03299 family)
MAHDINITNGRASIALAVRSAWHRLGRVLADAFDTATALREANMDWEVELQPCYTQDMRQIPAKKVVIRKDTQAVLGVVGDRYKPLQNRDAFGFFDGCFGKDEARFEAAGVLGAGERVWMLARVPGDFDVLPDDQVAPYLLLTNGHDGGQPVTAIFTPIRVVCQNTLSDAMKAARKGQAVRVLHTASVEDRLRIAGELLSKAGVFLDETTGLFRLLARTQLRAPTMRDYFACSLGEQLSTPFDELSGKRRNQILELEKLHEEGIGHDIRGVRGTLWGAYNAVTEYVDHKRTTDSLDWMAAGGGADLKARALTVAHEMALNLN